MSNLKLKKVLILENLTCVVLSLLSIKGLPFSYASI
jgi:hypothetical protein